MVHYCQNDNLGSVSNQGIFWHLTERRGPCERIWRLIELIFPADIIEGWRFLLRVVLGPLPEVPTDDVIKCAKKRPKTPKTLTIIILIIIVMIIIIMMMMFRVHKHDLRALILQYVVDSMFTCMSIFSLRACFVWKSGGKIP